MNVSNGSDNKMKRKKFFYYSGAAAFGIFSITEIPLKYIREKIISKSKTPIKITNNPHAIARKSGKINNG